MCPEFLREGSGVADFFNPPFVVVGTADQRVTDLLTDSSRSSTARSRWSMSAAPRH